MLRSQAAIRRLERRVEVLERTLGAAQTGLEDDLRRARSILFDELRAGQVVDPVPFAARNDLRLESVERAIDEFKQKGWAVEIDDETP